MAVWPDILTTGGGLGTSPTTNPFACWTWLENNYNTGTRQTLVNWFGTSAGNRRFLRLAKTTPGWQNGIFSSQSDINFYGFNWTDNYNARWGFGWNENGGGWTSILAKHSACIIRRLRDIRFEASGPRL